MKKRWIAVFGAVIIILLLLLSALGIYSEYLEINEIGKEYTTVFFTDIFARLEMMGILFVVIFIISAVNLTVVKNNIKSATGNSYLLLKRKFILLESGVLSLFGSLVFSESLYRKFLLLKNTVKAGIKEPIFDLDITYFFFTRDALTSAVSDLITVLVTAIVVSAIIYFVLIAQREKAKIISSFTQSKAFVHLAALAVLLCLLTGVMYYFNAQGIVLENNGLIDGATFTDVNIKLPFYRMAPFILLAVSILATIFLFRKKYKATGIMVLIFPVLLALLSTVTGLVQLLYVEPNEATLEAEYIEHNIKYTRIGYKLDNVVDRTFPAEENLTREILEEKSDIINNIRITDPQATLEVLNSTKSIRNYYTFSDSDIVEYEINGKPTAVNISAREMDVTKLDQNADNYINRTFKYTHGYGIVMNPVNWVNSEGQPDCVISDMPIESREGAPLVTEPRIYYGEKTNNYCIVDSDIDEFDYALNNENVEKNYEGTKSGIKLNLLNRLIFSIKNADYTMLISGYVNSESRLLTNRNILQRVNKAVPFMYVDSDPYLLVDSEGKLMWIVDLYTASYNMPYSDCYIRNSAKAVVDAYEGTVTVYITDKTDAIVMTYKSIYPKVFSEAEFPEELNRHIRYPEYLFKLQAKKYLRYHVDDAEMFYSNSDLWMEASEKYGSNEVINVVPYYNLLSVEDFGKEGAQLVLMMPFVPANKENLVSWLASDSYGNLISYKFPSGRTVYGTLHIENRIDADSDISKELSLWDQGGSKVLRGNVLVIPIADSIIYVEPVYITTNNSAAVPEVKRIIVAYGDRVVMRETLNECFDELFGKASEGGEGTNKPSDTEIENAYKDAAGAIEAYDKMTEALTKGDWSAFGNAMEELGNAIDTLR